MNSISCADAQSRCGEVFKNFLSEYDVFLKALGRILTPTQITIGRGLLIIPAWYLWHIGGSHIQKEVAIVIVVTSWYGDHLDGAVARATNQVTELGKKLDPLIDKFVFYGSAIVFWNQIWLLSFLPLLLLDCVSTFAREKNGSVDTGANIFGKYKLTLQVASSLSFAVADVYQMFFFVIVANICICIALILACISVYKRTIPSWQGQA